MKILLTLFLIQLALTFSIDNHMTSPSSNLDADLANIRQSRHLMGIQLEVTNRTHILYHGNFGLKDNIKPIKNQTVFRIASLSKSIVAAGIMLLVQQKKISLNQSLSSIFGYQIKNPFFPTVDITLQMILSHQSSLIQCEPYYTNFLIGTGSAKTGADIPSIKQILLPGGKYYNTCLFSNKYPPGKHYQYVNLNFGIAGTIIQIASGIRFDLFIRQRISKYISVGLAEIATFQVGTLQNPQNLGTCFEGDNGKWVPQVDYYPDGKIPLRNMTGYVVGTNGVVFGPQGSMRASVSHLSNYIGMLANKGVTKEGTRVLSVQSVQQMLKPRYQYHGEPYGTEMDFHTYGFGLKTTTYRKSDQIIPHEVVRGHTGSAYGLASAYYFWGNYTLTYIMNGALYGYEDNTGTIYERERMLLCQAVYKYITALNEKKL